MYKNGLNLRKMIAITICFASFVAVFAQETGVVINGVKWSTRNVNTSGTFVQTPEDCGEYYQWNKGTTDFLIEEDYYDSSYPKSTSWLPINDPSPAGWRIPASEEIQKLLDTEKVTNEWIIQKGVNGRKFTDKINGNSIFLPALGYIDGIDGLFYYIGEVGLYWSNTVFEEDADRAYVLIFNNDIMGCGDGIKVNSTLIRPVADNTTEINEISMDTEKANVLGYFDLLGRKQKEEPTTGIYIIQYDNGKTKKIMK